MRRAIIAAGVVFVLAGTTAVYAQHWPQWPGRWHGFSRSADDMSALADARIAAVKAGLRLTAEQEKMWPPVEAAARDLAKLRIDRVPRAATTVATGATPRRTSCSIASSAAPTT